MMDETTADQTIGNERTVSRMEKQEPSKFAYAVPNKVITLSFFPKRDQKVYRSEKRFPWLGKNRQLKIFENSLISKHLSSGSRKKKKRRNLAASVQSRQGSLDETDPADYVNFKSI